MISYHGGRVMVHSGDCREVLAGFDPDQFDACVTDPPYHLTNNTGTRSPYPGQYTPIGKPQSPKGGFMGKAWDGGDVAFRPETWAAVLRVMKPGAHLVAFAGTRTYHRMACAIEDAGFEIRDAIMWHYGSGFPKSHDISKAIDRAAGAEREIVGPGRWNHVKGNSDQSECLIRPGNKHDETAPATAAAREWQGWGTALKPATEILCLARKPLSERTIAANVLHWGTGAINVDGCRVGTGEVRQSSTGGLGRKAHPVYGEFARTEVEEITTTLGRWPANLVHDGSEEVVSGFPETADSQPGGNRGSSQIWGSAHEQQERNGFSDSGSAARFFATFPQEPEKHKRYWYGSKADSDDRLASRHPTIKPVALISWLCRLITPPRGLILDPFAGTGTTAEAALREGFRATLIEREAEYLADIDRRMSLVFEGEVGRSVAMAKCKPEGEPLPLFAGLADVG